MNEYQNIELNIHDHVLTISLNRPEKHNALNAEMIAELSKVFTGLQSNNEIRVVVLRGKGKSFCAGADLNYMKEIAAFGEKQNFEDAMGLAELFECIYTCPKPVIALVHGAVFGGANGLTAACDIVLAEDNTVFAFSEVKLGITPATISPYVIRRCGEAAARELMLSGRRFTAFEAFRFMLVNKTYELANQDELIQYYIKEFKAAAPLAVSSCKKLIADVASNKNHGADLIKNTAALIAAQRASDEGQEGMKAFFEKRKPNWSI